MYHIVQLVILGSKAMVMLTFFMICLNWIPRIGKRKVGIPFSNVFLKPLIKVCIGTAHIVNHKLALRGMTKGIIAYFFFNVVINRLYSKQIRSLHTKRWHFLPSGFIIGGLHTFLRRKIWG
jgi:hypothetical protein